MRWLTNFYNFRFKWTATVAIGIHSTKAWLSQVVKFKNAIWTWGDFRRTICNKIVLNLEKMPQKYMECFRLLLEHLAWIEHQFLSGIRCSRKAGCLWGMTRSMGGVRMSIHQSWLAEGLGLLCWGFKGVQQEIPSEVAFPAGQSTSPQLHTCHRLWPRWEWRHFLTLPIVQTLLPVTFGYSLSSEVVAMRQLRWKRIWRRSLTR